MVIETERLYLREMTDEDFHALYKVLADPNIMRHYPYTFDEKRVRYWIERNIERYRIFSFGLWAVCLKETDEMIGDCGLTMQLINGEIRPEIGYHIRADKQLKGDVIRKIISEENYEVNEDKFRLQYAYQRQEVTGLIVNNKISVPEKLITEIENAIYYCNKYGVVNHMSKMKIDKGFYREHLYGIAYFIKMIDKEKGEKYLSKLDEINWPI